jgi:hypothetical protein
MSPKRNPRLGTGGGTGRLRGRASSCPELTTGVRRHHLCPLCAQPLGLLEPLGVGAHARWALRP